MRQSLARRAAIIMGALLLAAVVVFALVAVGDDEPAGRTETILALEADPAAGEEVFLTIAQPSCGDCHSLADAGTVSERASDLDVLAPSAVVTIDSIVAGTIRAHDAQGYDAELSDRQIADLAAYVAEATGADE